MSKNDVFVLSYERARSLFDLVACEQFDDDTYCVCRLFWHPRYKRVVLVICDRTGAFYRRPNWQPTRGTGDGCQFDPTVKAFARAEDAEAYLLALSDDALLTFRAV